MRYILTILTMTLMAAMKCVLADISITEVAPPGVEIWHTHLGIHRVKHTQSIGRETSNTTVFMKSVSGAVYPLNAETGAFIGWQFPITKEIDYPYPQVHKGKAFIWAEDRFLYCLEIKTGKVLWRSNEPVKTEPYVGERFIYYVTQSGALQQVQHARATFSIRRTYTPSGAQELTSPPFFYSVKEYGAAVFVGTSDGYVHAIDPDSGQLKEVLPSGSRKAEYPPVKAPLFATGNFLYFARRDIGDTIYRVDLGQGESKVMRDVHTLKGKITGNPRRAQGGELLIGSTAGELLLIRLDGESSPIKANGQDRYALDSESVWVLPAHTGAYFYVVVDNAKDDSRWRLYTHPSESLRGRRGSGSDGSIQLELTESAEPPGIEGNVALPVWMSSTNVLYVATVFPRDEDEPIISQLTALKLDGDTVGEAWQVTNRAIDAVQLAVAKQSLYVPSTAHLLNRISLHQMDENPIFNPFAENDTDLLGSGTFFLTRQDDDMYVVAEHIRRYDINTHSEKNAYSDFGSIEIAPYLSAQKAYVCAGEDLYVLGLPSLQRVSESGGRYSADSTITTAPVVFPKVDEIYIGNESGQIHAIQEIRGSTQLEKKWMYQAQGRGEITSMALDDKAGRLYAGSKNGKVYALNVQAAKPMEFGEVRQLDTIGAGLIEFEVEGEVCTELALSEELLFVGAFDDDNFLSTVYGLDKSRLNDIEWRWTIEDELDKHLLFALDKLFVVSGKNLYALDVNLEGELLWKFPAVSRIVGLYHHGSDLYLYCRDGTLYRLDIS